MGRPADGGPTCEGCLSIDVRRWHRDGRLSAGQSFNCSWSFGGRSIGRMGVRTECDALVLTYQLRGWDAVDLRHVQQRVEITWTACHLGGERPWFICSGANGGRCGQRVAILYGAGGLFACRRCYRLAYRSQRETPRDRSIGRARKIRMRLGGTPDLLAPFPDRPKGMHRRTYLRLRARAKAAEGASFEFLQRSVDRLGAPFLR
jgi:hypothetical protein